MRVSEIFYSIQGEGYWAGTPAKFIRLNVCNIRCPFCDTKGAQDPSSGREMSIEEICAPGGIPEVPLVVVTGGEPTIQPGLADLVEALIGDYSPEGPLVQIETNGTNWSGLSFLKPLPHRRVWVTVSPKTAGLHLYPPAGEIRWCDELKVVLDPRGPTPEEWLRFFVAPPDRRFVQPLSEDYGPAVRYCLEHPTWRLSIQTQKVLRIR